MNNFVKYGVVGALIAFFLYRSRAVSKLVDVNVAIYKFGKPSGGYPDIVFPIEFRAINPNQTQIKLQSALLSLKIGGGSQIGTGFLGTPSVIGFGENYFTIPFKINITQLILAVPGIGIDAIQSAIAGNKFMDVLRKSIKDFTIVGIINTDSLAININETKTL